MTEYDYQLNKFKYNSLVCQLNNTHTEQSGGSRIFSFEVDEYATASQMFIGYSDKLSQEFRNKDRGDSIKMIFSRRPTFGKEYYDSKTVIRDLLDEIMETDEFKEFVKTIHNYKDDVEKQWVEHKDLILDEVKDIMKVDFPPLEPHTIVIMPRGGSNYGHNKIYWGALNNHEFPNYAIIYFMHEYLHTVFGKSDIEHAIIELITDNELRKRLNKNDTYQLGDKASYGHTFLHELRNAMMEDWTEYLTTNKYRDIFEFVAHAQEKFSDIEVKW
jgi:hypothetical protein